MVESPGFVAAMDSATGVEAERLAIAARVVVLVVSYNGIADLCECLESLVSAHGNDDSVHLVVLDNASTDGSPDAIEQQFPQVTVLRSDKNLGYAGGGNAGWRWIQQNCPDVEYLCVLNPDIIVEPNWLDALVDHLDQNPEVGLAQPMICLEPERHLINNLGLRCHYLGFAYQLNYRDRVDSNPPTPREVDAVSGAALIVRASHVMKHGLFNDDLFMYMEDVELSWRVRASCLKCACVPKSVVFHKYSPDAIRKHYCRLERNRYLLVLSYYPLSSLFVLFPAFIMMELAQWIWAITTGRFMQRFTMWSVFILSATALHMTTWRRANAESGLHLDRTSLGKFSGRLESGLVCNSMSVQIADFFFGRLWAFFKHLIIGNFSLPRRSSVKSLSY